MGHVVVLVSLLLLQHFLLFDQSFRLQLAMLFPDTLLGEVALLSLELRGFLPLCLQVDRRLEPLFPTLYPLFIKSIQDITVLAAVISIF